MPSEHSGFRQRFQEGQILIGSFLKIAQTMPAEILGTLGYDFVVVDEEHGALNRESTDHILLACRAHGIGGLVRVPSADPAGIQSVLDCGGDGVLVPHVDSAEKARAIVAAARYRGGMRGYSSTTRAGDFGGRSIAQHLDEQDTRATVIAMIEDPHALDALDEILAVEGLDGVFIGRGDLTVAYGEVKGGSAPVKAATEAITAAARAAGKPICVMASGPEDAAALAAQGATAFIVSSDQTFLRKAAAATLTETRTALQTTR
ncbi:5-keto-4-deoxy-D-glucarate aldolase [Pseudooceanicola marinus]|uniref:5-keto-4-deoxy-D-glucarate aldolase n=1 Tax=Pseudooceanicola marinus TaxID=396013 RepID=A0A1X6Z4R1_9RHOB|nr:aldolase/citrate lyase family protein [Pseudooceanicola marinus]SLN40697.1 5-keto-4-deoxy-D-glucarate aldolase [Pseudooceanicola marinus]